jgi:hypothetical protein
MSYEPYVPPPGVNSGPSTAPGASNHIATGYIMPGSIGNTGRRSDIDIAFSYMFAGPNAWRAADCMRDVFGLPVEQNPREVVFLDLGLLYAAIVAEEAREAKRVADIKAGRAAYTKQFADVVAEREAERKQYAKDVLPRKKAVGDKVLAAIAKLDTEGYFSAMTAAIREEAEADLPMSEYELIQAQRMHEAQKREAEPVPAERFDVMQLTGDVRGWVPECLSLLKSVRDDKQREREAHIARLRADYQLLGGV